MILDDGLPHDKEEHSSCATIPRATVIRRDVLSYRNDCPWDEAVFAVSSHDALLEPLLGWMKPIHGRKKRVVSYVLLLTFGVLLFVFGITVVLQELAATHPLPEDSYPVETSTSLPYPTGPPRIPSSPTTEDTGLPVPSIPGLCIPSTSWRRHSNGNVISVTTQFPANAEALSFDSLGSLAEGSISLTTSSSRSDRNIDVEVFAYHKDSAILDRAVLCLQQGETNNVHSATVLTNTSRSVDQFNPVRYDIKVSFPGPDLAIPGRPRYYGPLKTNLPFFRHEVYLPADQVRFEYVSLRSATARMSVPSLSADNIDVMTTDYPVDGSFDVSSSIGLNTTGANIDVSISMASNKDGVASAFLNTADGLVHATIECRTWHPLHPGSFQIFSSTTNATSTTILRNLPIGASLTVDASTTGDIITELPLAFEGAFRISSPDPQVLYNPLASDPSGGRRKRVMKLLEYNPIVQGIVHWSQFLRFPKASGKGTINLRTTEGRATLKL